ncbi:DUF1571 domain-containing protein [Candidatus Burkholderia verschuerenii]|nr:DUF1571 domain-containing protein [Candidatus Burkholderia verschuerenii]
MTMRLALAQDFDIARIGKLDVDAQARWLADAADDGTLDDDRLTQLFRALDPLAVPRYLQNGKHDYVSYEFTMRRRERIKGVWPKRADHMLVRVTHEPLRIYAKWLPDGAHAGQEILYDDAKRPDQIYGHLGGWLRVMPMWTSIDGSLARAQSNHSIRELGIDTITQRFLDEGQKFAEAGVTKPSKNIEVREIGGVRVVAFTYETPTGQPEFYAKKEILGLDLKRPLFRAVESFDNDGNIFESVVFEQIEEKTFDDLTFDPKNPEYRF